MIPAVGVHVYKPEAPQQTGVIFAIWPCAPPISFRIVAVLWDDGAISLCSSLDLRRAA